MLIDGEKEAKVT